MDLNLYLQFCAKGNPKYAFLLFPIDDGEWSYCSDARICLRVPKFEHKSGVEATQKTIEALRGFFAKNNHKDYQPLPATPEGGWGKPCESCEATGKIDEIVCACCGSRMALPNEIVTDCPNCEGRGRFVSRKEFLVVGHQAVSHYYLALISSLPNVTIAPSPTGELDHLHFRFDGGEGVIMPMRKD